MPRYFFHVNEGAERIEDHEGLDLPDVQAAVTEAVKAAREMVSERVLSGRSIAGSAIDVTANGSVIETISLDSVIHRHDPAASQQAVKS